MLACGLLATNHEVSEPSATTAQQRVLDGGGLFYDNLLCSALPATRLPFALPRRTLRSTAVAGVPINAAQGTVGALLGAAAAMFM